MENLLVVNIFILIMVFAIGAVIASFLNVVIYRLPRGEGFIAGNSYCPKCEHKLQALDLFPVLSYLFLGRKCRYCKDPISPRYMVVELIGGIMAVISYLAFFPPLAFLLPGSEGKLFAGGSAATLGLVADWLPVAIPSLTGALISAIFVFLVLCLLILVAFIDGDTMEIPDSLSIWLAVLGVISVFIGPYAGLPWYSHLIGLFCVSVPMLVITIIVDGAFGIGDVKLMAAVGLILGWQNILLATFIGILFGGVYGIFLLVSRKKGRKEHFAFGPALCAGITISIFLGNVLLTWYGAFFI
jgi:leader peptidase (prepilin peptidase)/N-methyltransferase